MKNFSLKCLIILSSISFLLSSCEPKTSDVVISNDDSVYLVVDELMHTVYYWKDKVTPVNFKDYSHPTDMMRDMRYDRYDRWSEVYERSLIEEFLTGESLSYGISPAWDTDDNIRAGIVYTKTEAYDLGVRRGDILERINGTDPKNIYDWEFFFAPRLGEEVDLLIRKNDGTSKEITVSAQEVEIDDVLHSEIIDKGNSKIGYLVYENFSTVSKETLLDIMRNFKSEGVNELIIDLRYNGGGEVDVLLDWANYVIKDEYTSRTFMNITHNRDYSSEDIKHTLNISSNSLELDRVFVITTESTASASEALIKCFEPYLDVHTIGTRTHGKPVGMYLFEFQDWYLLPIAFEYTNAYVEGGFFNGIEPEKYVIANPDADWGDQSDECLAEALYYIENGSFTTNMYTSIFKSDLSQFPSKQIGLFVRK